MRKLNGRCFCGAVGWSSDGPVTRKLVCHCVDCRRATSSGFTAFIGIAPEDVRWTGEINHFESSPGSQRGFCPKCGTRLYFRSEKWPAEIHLHAATLEDQRGYVPDRHVKFADCMDWIKIADQYPKFQGFSVEPAGEFRDV